jgi:hypothetical protein
MNAMIKCEEVSPFIFSHERAVRIQGAKERYSLIVDESVLRGDMMFVTVLDENEDTAFVQLPGETLNAGTRVYVPVAALVRNVSRL